MTRCRWCITLILTLYCWWPAHAQTGQTVRTVVIDPGHGGRDPGALGSRSKEKDINLAVARKLGERIEKSANGVRVIYTRKTDVFVELFRRAAIANEARADLFISIHCNASRNRNLKGAETYIMGLHRSEANLNIAKFENAAILLESDYTASYDGFDPNSDESYIIFSMNQNLNLDRSTALAAAIQEQLTKRVGMADRGVRQAGFLVLYKTAMPSVLVETGYISHSGDESFLASSKGQDFIANAIFTAFMEYTGKAGTPPADEPGTPPARVDPVPDPTGGEGIREVPAGALSWRVQVASESRRLPDNHPKFKKLGKVSMYRHNGLFKYTVGDEENKSQALGLLEKVKELGFRDAFVVIFRNGARIPQPEADSLLKK